MKKKILMVLLVLIFLYCIGGIIYSVFISRDNKLEDEKSVLDISGFNYKIDENNVSSIYATEFKKLKENLESNEINYTEYVESIAKLYIIDLYSLKDKINKYDVSASQYINIDTQENFKLKVSETLYKYIEDNSNKDRKQVLPRVSGVIIKNIENTNFIINDLEHEAYNINIEWNYEEDLGYDTSAILTLIKCEKEIFVAEEKRVDINLEIENKKS